MSLELPVSSIDEWLKELKPYQRNTITKLLEDHEPVDVAKSWITSEGSATTIPFGGVHNPKPFWDNFINEFNKFICDDREYENEKKELKKEAPISKALIIAVIGGALAQRLGLAASLLAPAIALLLFTVGNITVNAYCATNFKQAPKE
jgi:hypothetical protein